MKRQQREVYAVLADEIGWSLCSFCKYSEFGGSPCYGDADCECKHPLDAVPDFTDALDGSDCWGYRPIVRLRDIADIVGLILSQGFDPEKTMYSFDKEGIEVTGVKKGLT